MFMKHYAPNRCEPMTEVIVKMPKKSGDRGCEFLLVKMTKKKKRSGERERDRERERVVIVKIYIKKARGGGGVWI